MLAFNRNYDVDFDRKPNQSYLLAMRPNSPMVGRFDHSNRVSHRETSISELDSKPLTHRKRVPVACERCRKRKIKCSGDEGDGRGCVNCKNAGSEGCQFLRVSSWNTPVNPAVVGVRCWQQPQRWQPYNQQRMISAQLGNQNYASETTASYSQWPTGNEYVSYPSPPHPSTWSRPPCYSNYVSFEPDTTNPYTTQPPPFMLPGLDVGSRFSVSCGNPALRFQQSSTWVENINNMSGPLEGLQSLSSGYPLTPIDSHKSCGLLTNPGMPEVNSERSCDDPTIISNPICAEAPMQDTPPLSAVSHGSTNVWPANNPSEACWISDHTTGGSNSQKRSIVDGSERHGSHSSQCYVEDESAVPPSADSGTIVMSNYGIAVSKCTSLPDELPGTKRLRIRTSQESLPPSTSPQSQPECPSPAYTPPTSNIRHGSNYNQIHLSERYHRKSRVSKVKSGAGSLNMQKHDRIKRDGFRASSSERFPASSVCKNKS